MYIYIYEESRKASNVFLDNDGIRYSLVFAPFGLARRCAGAGVGPKNLSELSLSEWVRDYNG